MDTGRLNKRITYTTAPVFTPDGIGGQTVTTPGTKIETWCGSRELSLGELVRLGLPTEYRTNEFTFQHGRGKNIARGMTLEYQGAKYRVQTTSHDELRNQTKVIASNQGGT